MTSPDQARPDGAISNTGLAAFARKTQADWEAEQRNAMTAAWTPAQQGFYNLITQIPIVGDVAEIITGVPDADPNDFGSAVNNAKNVVGEVWNGLVGTVTSIFSGVAGVIGGIVDAITGNDHSTPQAAVAQHGISFTRVYSTTKRHVRGVTDVARNQITSGSSLVSDPYGSQPAFWDTSVADLSTDYARSGANSLRIISTGASEKTLLFTPNDLGDLSPIKCKANDVFLVEAYVLADPTNVGLGSVSLVAQVSDSTGVSPMLSPVLTDVTFTVPTVGMWLKIWKLYTIPEGYDQFSGGVKLATNATTAGDKFYIDDMFIREQTVAQGAIDGINQAVTGTAGTGASITTVKSNIEGLVNSAGASASALNALRAGYTVNTITSTQTWTKPTGITELYVALWSAGAKGAGTGGVSAGTGGAAGRVIAAQLDPASITDGAGITCTISVGTTTTPGATSFGSIITTDDAYKSYVSTPLGLMQTFASAGSGGSGGAPNQSGSNGVTTTFGASGGAGGAASTSKSDPATAGGAGGNGSNFGLCQTGGGGGGGGGGGSSTYSTIGATGGVGGFPGGGGGGGGAQGSDSTRHAVGGDGGNGLMLIVYKRANET